MNTVMTRWAYTLYAAMPALRTEKPPVPPVAKTVHSASNAGISTTSSRNSITESPK